MIYNFIEVICYYRVEPAITARGKVLEKICLEIQFSSDSCGLIGGVIHESDLN